MRPVAQTKRGGPNVPPAERGDCLQASLASLLEVPIDHVEIPWSDEHWWDCAQRAVRQHGFTLVVASAAIWPDTWWLAGVPSLNLHDAGRPVPHMIVMSAGAVAHDPSLGERYAVGTPVDELKVLDAFVLVPNDQRSRA